MFRSGHTVSLKLNGEMVPLSMTLDSKGHAYFSTTEGKYWLNRIKLEKWTFLRNPKSFALLISNSGGTFCHLYESENTRLKISLVMVF